MIGSPLSGIILGVNWLGSPGGLLFILEGLPAVVFAW